MRTTHMLALAVLACGLSGYSASGQEAADMRLKDAGFVMRPADTPEKLARLKRLPPRKLVAHSRAGKRYFVYADPDYCKCVFLGDQRAMQAYRDMLSPPPGAPGLPDIAGRTRRAGAENQLIEDMNADVSSSIYDGDILDFTK